MIYRSGLNAAQALEEAKKSDWCPEAQAFFDFIATAKKRGFCSIKPLRRDDESTAEEGEEG